MKQSAGALFRTAWVLIANRVVHSGTSVRIAWALPISLFCLGNPEDTSYCGCCCQLASRDHWFYFHESFPRTQDRATQGTPQRARSFRTLLIILHFQILPNSRGSVLPYVNGGKIDHVSIFRE